MRRFWFSTLVLVLAISLVVPPFVGAQDSVLDK